MPPRRRIAWPAPAAEAGPVPLLQPAGATPACADADPPATPAAEAPAVAGGTTNPDPAPARRKKAIPWPKTKEFVTVIFETGLHIDYYKAEFNSEKPSGSHNQKGKKQLELQAAIQSDARYEGRVPSAKCINGRMNDDVAARILEIGTDMPGNKTGDGDEANTAGMP